MGFVDNTDYPYLSAAELKARNDLLVTTGRTDASGNAIGTVISPNHNNAWAMESMVNIFNSVIAKSNADPANKDKQKPLITFDKAEGYTPAVGQALKAAMKDFKASTSYRDIKAALGLGPGPSVLEDPVTAGWLKATEGNPEARKAKIKEKLLAAGFPASMANDPAQFVALVEESDSIVSGYDKLKANNNVAGVAKTIEWNRIEKAKKGQTSTDEPPPPLTGAETPDPAAAPNSGDVAAATTTVETALGLIYQNRTKIPGMENMLDPGAPDGKLAAPEQIAIQNMVMNLKKYLFVQGKYSGKIDGTYDARIGALLQGGINSLDADSKKDLFSKLGDGAEAQLPQLFGALDTLSKADGNLLGTAEEQQSVVASDEELQGLQSTSRIAGIMKKLPPGLKKGLGQLLQNLGPFGQILMMLVQAFTGIDMSQFLGDGFKLGADGVPTEEQMTKAYQDAMADPEIQKLPEADRPAAIKTKLLSGVGGMFAKFALGADKQKELEGIITEACDKAADAAKKTPAEDPAAVFGRVMHARIQEKKLLPEGAPAPDNSQPQGGAPQGQPQGGPPSSITTFTPPPSMSAQSDWFNNLPPISESFMNDLKTKSLYNPTEFYNSQVANGMAKGAYVIMGMDAKTRADLGLGNNIIITRDVGGTIVTTMVDINSIPGGIDKLPELLNQDASAIRSVSAISGSANSWRVAAFGTGGGSLEGSGTTLGNQEYRNGNCTSGSRAPQRTPGADVSGGNDQGYIRRRTRGDDATSGDYRRGYGDGYDDGSNSSRFNRFSGRGYPYGYRTPEMARDFYEGGYGGRRSYAFRENGWDVGGRRGGLGLEIGGRGFNLGLGIRF